MFRDDGKLRLSTRDLRRWARITGFEPVGIRCLADLAAYVQVCKAHYWGTSKETRFIHWLIDEEFRRCVGSDWGPPAMPAATAGLNSSGGVHERTVRGR